ncbi:conjugative transfer protein [Lysobacteraceae bacterium NML93-0792]|nr:conjugative transfer protein [Xanthomonadaceae bacterium NML93-0792]PBS16823.1 conjugative transfer protein [Xanthomonadaceae bacterium NML93-0793]PBS19420.1 conjugative transfer protein [Xanthomonadaceae bacterium NML93-0831]
MFGKRNTETPAVERAVAQGVSFELTLTERSKRSEKRAWLVAWSAVVMSLVLAGGYLLLLPLKEKVPYLVMADPYTGTASVARLVGDFENRDVTASEAINKSNVANFILARESYDSGLIGQRNWRTTLSMAGPAVAPAYVSLHSEGNPERPFRVYGPTKALHVRILSIVLIGGGEGRRPSGATVRFQRNVYDKGRGRSDPLDNKIATMEFSYNQDLRLSDEDRLLNPLGFRVTNYRVDNDFAPAAASPAVAEMAQVVPQAQPASAAMDPNTAGMIQPGTAPEAAMPAIPAEQMEGVGTQGERQ